MNQGWGMLLFLIFNIFNLLVPAENAAQAGDHYTSPAYFEDFAQGIMKAQRDHEKQLLQESPRSMGSCESCNSAEQRTCQTLALDFKDKAKIRVGIFYGYFDAKDYTLDPMMSQTIVKYLKSPCASSDTFFVCGFTSDKNQENLLFKDVVWPDGSQKRIEVGVYSSAETSIDADNIKSATQKLRSNQIRSAFNEALRKFDVVIYEGHARYGGGPDFYPRKSPEGIEKSSQSFRKEKTGLKDILKSLQARGSKRLPLLALSACSSNKHFAPALLSLENPPVLSYLAKEAGTLAADSPLYPEIFNLVLRGQCPRTEPLTPRFVIKKKN